MTASPYILVLAKNTHEGSIYVRRANLPRGRWRNVASASSIRGIRFATIHKLPSFDKRPDRHAILAELRHAKCEWVDVEMPGAEDRVIDQGDGMGQQLTLEDAFIANALEAGRSKHGPTLLTETDVAELEAIPWTIDDRSLEVAYRYNALRNQAILEAEFRARMSSEGQAATIAAATEEISNALETPAPKARRRSRCGSCDELHFGDEPCAPKPIVKKAVDPIAMFS